MANENKITQIIINQESYTIGEDSAGFITLTGSEMISTLKSGVYYFGDGESIVPVLLTILQNRTEYYVIALIQNRIFIYDGVDTTLIQILKKGYNILMSDTNINADIPIMWSDEYTLSEISGTGFADINGSTRNGFIIYSHGKYPDYQQLTGLSAECKAFKFQGNEETVLKTAANTAEPFMAEEDDDIVTKKYLDTALAGVEGIPKYYGNSRLLPATENGFIMLVDTPCLYYRRDSNVFILTPVQCFLIKSVTDDMTFNSVMVPENAYARPSDAGIVTKKFADETYASAELVNSLVQRLEALENLHIGADNLLTNLDRQTLDVIENKVTE